MRSFTGSRHYIVMEEFVVLIVILILWAVYCGARLGDLNRTLGPTVRETQLDGHQRPERREAAWSGDSVVRRETNEATSSLACFASRDSGKPTLTSEAKVRTVVPGSGAV